MVAGTFDGHGAGECSALVSTPPSYIGDRRRVANAMGKKAPSFR
ncbi:hypothetical protein [Synechocystis sp. LEGE 06083]|nr:hypothetical protein [Synechocystis sp. LEGE 06083]